MSKYHEDQASEASDDDYSGQDSESSMGSFIADESEVEVSDDHAKRAKGKRKTVVVESDDDSAPEVTTYVPDRKKSKEKSKSKDEKKDKKKDKKEKEKDKKSKKSRVSDSDGEAEEEVAEAEAEADADMDAHEKKTKDKKEKKDKKKKKEKKDASNDDDNGDAPAMTSSDKKDAEKADKTIQRLEELGIKDASIVLQTKHSYPIGQKDMTAPCLPGLLAKAVKDGQVSKEFTDAEIDALFPKLCACKSLAQAESQFTPLETLIWAVLNFWPGQTKDSPLRLMVWGVKYVSGTDVKVTGFTRAGMEPPVAGGPTVIVFGRPGCTIRYMDARPYSKVKDGDVPKVTIGTFCEFKDTLSTLGKTVEEVIATGPVMFFMVGPKKLPRPPVEVKGATTKDIGQMLNRRGPAIVAPPADDASPSAVLAAVGTALADGTMPADLKDLGEGSVFELTITPKRSTETSCLKAALLKYLDTLRSLGLPPKPTVLLSPELLKIASVKGVKGIVATVTQVSPALGHVAFVGSGVPVSDADGTNLRGSVVPAADANPAFSNTIFVLASEAAASKVSAGFTKVGPADTHTITVHPIPKLPPLNF